jgi:phosphatidylserine/phosphatidylglycerophosphate/cardiolipin synthase-like enzyme
VVIRWAHGLRRGVDLCEGRWDERDHRPDNPLRVNQDGSPQKPYHDVMAFCKGPIVDDLSELFCARWQSAGGLPIDLAKPASRPEIEVRRRFPHRVPRCRDQQNHADESAEGRSVQEIAQLYVDAISAADQLVYIETQYFTSTAVHDALIERFNAADRPRLEVVVILLAAATHRRKPSRSATPQNRVLRSLRDRRGKERSPVPSVLQRGARLRRPRALTFVHSKVLTVDDRLLSIGSANCTNRSMHVDSELNFVWECSNDGPDELKQSVARFRASLTVGTFGAECDATLERRSGLISRLDQLTGKQHRLRPRPIPQESEDLVAHHCANALSISARPLDEIELQDLI